MQVLQSALPGLNLRQTFSRFGTQSTQTAWVDLSTAPWVQGVEESLFIAHAIAKDLTRSQEKSYLQGVVEAFLVLNYGRGIRQILAHGGLISTDSKALRLDQKIGSNSWRDYRLHALQEYAADIQDQASRLARSSRCRLVDWTQGYPVWSDFRMALAQGAPRDHAIQARDVLGAFLASPTWQKATATVLSRLLEMNPERFAEQQGTLQHCIRQLALYASHEFLA